MSVTTDVPEGAVRPFIVEIPEEDLETLRTRIATTRWPEKELVEDQSQGVAGAGTLRRRSPRGVPLYSVTKDARDHVPTTRSRGNDEHV